MTKKKPPPGPPPPIPGGGGFGLLGGGGGEKEECKRNGGPFTFVFVLQRLFLPGLSSQTRKYLLHVRNFDLKKKIQKLPFNSGSEFLFSWMAFIWVSPNTLTSRAATKSGVSPQLWYPLEGKVGLLHYCFYHVYERTNQASPVSSRISNPFFLPSLGRGGGGGGGGVVDGSHYAWPVPANKFGFSGRTWPFQTSEGSFSTTT